MAKTNVRGNAPEPVEPQVGFAAATSAPVSTPVPGKKKPTGRLAAGYATARKLSPQQRAASGRRAEAERGARANSANVTGAKQELAPHQRLQGGEPTIVPVGERPAPAPVPEENEEEPKARVIRPAGHLFAHSDIAGKRGVPGEKGVGVQLFEGNRTPEPVVDIDTPTGTPTPSPNSRFGQERSAQFSDVPDTPLAELRRRGSEVGDTHPLFVPPRGPVRLSPSRAVEVAGREVVDSPAASGSEPAWPVGRAHPVAAAARILGARMHRIAQGGVEISPEQFKPVVGPSGEPLQRHEVTPRGSSGYTVQDPDVGSGGPVTTGTPSEVAAKKATAEVARGGAVLSPGAAEQAAASPAPLLPGEFPPGTPASEQALPGEPEYVEPNKDAMGKTAWEASPRGAALLAARDSRESRAAKAAKAAEGAEKPDQFSELRSLIDAARHAQETGELPDVVPTLPGAPPHVQAMADAAFHGAGSTGKSQDTQDAEDYEGKAKEMVFSSPEAEDAAKTGIARTRPINGALGMQVGERVAKRTTASAQAHNSEPLSNLPVEQQAAARAMGIRAGTGNRRDVRRSHARRALSLHLDGMDHGAAVAFTNHLISTGDPTAENLLAHASNFFHPGVPGSEAYRPDAAKVYVARAYKLANKLTVNSLGRPDPSKLDLSTGPDSHHSLIMDSMAGSYGENKSYDQQQLEEKQAGQRKSRVKRIQRIYANQGQIPVPKKDEIAEDGTYLGLHDHEIATANRLLGAAKAANQLRGKNGADIGVLKSEDRKTLWAYMNRIHDALLSDKPQTIADAAGGPSLKLGAAPPRATGKNPESVDLSDASETMGEAFGLKDVGDTGIQGLGEKFTPEGQEDLTSEDTDIPEEVEHVAPTFGTDKKLDTEAEGTTVEEEQPAHISDAQWKKAKELVERDHPEILQKHGSDAHFAKVTQVAEANILAGQRKRNDTIVAGGTADFGETPDEQTIDRSATIPTKVVGQGGRLGRSQRDVLAGMQEIANQGAETLKYNAEQDRVEAERQAALTNATDAREAAIQSLENRLPRAQGSSAPNERDLEPIEKVEERVYNHFAKHGDNDTKVARASLKRVTEALHVRHMETYGDQPGYTMADGSPSAAAVEEVTKRIKAIKKDAMGESAAAAAW